MDCISSVTLYHFNWNLHFCVCECSFSLFGMPFLTRFLLLICLIILIIKAGMDFFQMLSFVSAARNCVDEIIRLTWIKSRMNCMPRSYELMHRFSVVAISYAQCVACAQFESVMYPLRQANQMGVAAKCISTNFQSLSKQEGTVRLLRAWNRRFNRVQSCST